jgi:nitroimidazol reductase NimA-like FMN-containing flavoprotein (pyridoxamine 5'-phosphate oxidase superfamily)
MAGTRHETDAAGIEVLGPDECRRTLTAGGVGCLGIPGSGEPILRPVNFVLHGDALVVRTAEGPILSAARRGDKASLEVHDIDRLEHTGWSVIVTGPMRELPTDAATLALPLRPWASGRKDRFVSIALDTVSGRRIPPGRGNR